MLGQNSEEDPEKQQKINRLNYLLTKATKFSEWLARQLEIRQEEQKQKEANAAARRMKLLKEAPKQNVKRTKKRNIELVEAEEDELQQNVTLGEDMPGRSERQPQSVKNVVMRDYQLVGMEWLISLYENGLNGILADEMGLGKTLQAIAFLAHLRENGVWGPYLIVAPVSTLTNWVSEIERFVPSVPVLLYHGSSQERQGIRDKKMNRLTKNFPWIVTSYDICMRDRKYLEKYSWKYIIIDEGHRLKNLNCKLIKELKRYRSANRLLLTGTPLQNNLTELWSLLNFLMPDIFDEVDAFLDWFNFEPDLGASDTSSKIVNKEQESSIITNLHQILKPFLLRRIKSEVAYELPKKTEYIVTCPIVPEQKRMYSAILKGTRAIQEAIHETLKEKGYLNQPEISQNTDRSDRRKARKSYDDIEEEKQNIKLSAIPKMGKMKLQNMVMQLRKICNHPFLFDALDTDILDQDSEHESDSEVESDYSDLEYDSSHSSDNEGEGYAGLPLTTPIKELPDLIKDSGKILMLECLLPRLFKENHKVLIFSQMTKMLDLLADFCLTRDWKFCRIDGDVKLEDRKMEIKRFSNQKKYKIFLLSTRSGGLGINLTAADTVILFDSDWNPQMDLQAQDRVHRIGQTKPVVVYRFVTEGTVEHKILERANAKRQLEKLVIHKGQFKGSRKYYESKKLLDLEELSDILRNEQITVESGHVQGKPLKTLADVISEEELNRIMNRESNQLNAENDALKETTLCGLVSDE